MKSFWSWILLLYDQSRVGIRSVVFNWGGATPEGRQKFLGGREPLRGLQHGKFDQLIYQYLFSQLT